MKTYEEIYTIALELKAELAIITKDFNARKREKKLSELMKERLAEWVQNADPTDPAFIGNITEMKASIAEQIEKESQENTNIDKMKEANRAKLNIGYAIGNLQKLIGESYKDIRKSFVEQKPEYSEYIKAEKNSEEL